MRLNDRNNAGFFSGNSGSHHSAGGSGRRCGGVISIFIALIFLSITSLLFGLVESSRTAGLRYYQTQALEASVESLFSEYDNELWDSYRLLFLCRSEEEMKEQLTSYMNPYLQVHSWMAMQQEEWELSDSVKAADDGGQWLEQEILEYMQFGIVQNLLHPDPPSEGILESLTDAASIQSVWSDYSGEAREAIAVEKAVRKIHVALLDAGDQQRKMAAAAASHDRAGLRTHAAELVSRLERVEDYIAAYEKQADRLAASLDALDERHREDYAKMTAMGKELLDSVMCERSSYADADGPRRRELTDIRARLPALETEVRETRNLADDIPDSYHYVLYDPVTDTMENISNAEEVAGMWSEVRGAVQEIDIPQPSGSYGLADEKKGNALENLVKILEGDLLSLVIPEGKTVSGAGRNLTEAPSRTTGAGSTGSTGEAGAGGSGSTESGNLTLMETTLLLEYIDRFFPCFTDQSKERPAYAVEYILAGGENDRESLSGALGKIFLLREGMNTAAILKDPERMQTVRSLAAGIAGGTALPFLIPAITVLLIGVWAGAESVTDLRSLLDGKRISLIKSDREWQCDLTGLLQSGEAGRFSGGMSPDSGKQGLTYMQYLKLLLLSVKREERNLRMLDHIQEILRKKRNDFCICRAVYSVRIGSRVRARHLFSPLGDFALTAVMEKSY